MKLLPLFAERRGGKRKGAGRKSPTGEPKLRHEKRAKFTAAQPLHITVKLRSGLRSLRLAAERRVVNEALAASRDRFAMRIVHFTIQSDHLHLIIEAPCRDAVTRGMQGFLVRLTKSLNQLWHRKGSILKERYHDEVITSPRQARNVLRYVLHNAQHHGIHLQSPIDPCSSGAAFDGWALPSYAPRALPTVVPPSVWLLTTGWRRHGAIGLHESPRAQSTRR